MQTEQREAVNILRALLKSAANCSVPGCVFSLELGHLGGEKRVRG
jgi:hypothetical protein